MSGSKKFSRGMTLFGMFLALIIGFVSGFLGWYFIKKPKDTGDVYVSGDLSVHFLELGNGFTGDSVYIKAGETDILIDAGSRAGSAAAIGDYVDGFCTDGVLEYVVATHAHQDHIAGFVGTAKAQGIFDRYECEVIIDFPLTNADSAVYDNYVKERDEEIAAGAAHYTALECWKEENGASRSFELAPGIEMRILYQKFYEQKTSDENDYSVCLMIVQGDRNFLFTGDLEGEGEKSLTESNDLPEVDVYKAGHHGSKTSSSQELLDIIKPDYVCVCCCAGSVEYTQEKANTFPTQAFIDRVAPFTDKVYVTTLGTVEWVDGKWKDTAYSSMNGDIVVTSAGKNFAVECSADNTLLKDTDWFRDNRTCPEAWAA